MNRRTISTVHEPVACAVCGRTLLRGEHPSAFLHAGHRRTVCELCTPRAMHDGWIREGADDARAVRRPRRTRSGGGFLERLRPRREDEELGEGQELDGLDVVAGEDSPRGSFSGGEFHPAPPEPTVPSRTPEADPQLPTPSEPRNVHAIPTNADLKVARAMDVFNAGQHPRTIASISRSLGVPFVCVRPSPTEGALVTIVVGWELSWYRYEVDLSDEAAGVRIGDKGYELSELDEADHVANAAADEHGYLHPAAPEA